MGAGLAQGGQPKQTKWFSKRAEKFIFQESSVKVNHRDYLGFIFDRVTRPGK
jgi:hypothetical protein